MFWFGLVDFTSFGVCSLSRYVTMQNLELVASKMSELCQFYFNLVWFGYVLVWFGMLLHHFVCDHYPDILPCKIWSL